MPPDSLLSTLQRDFLREFFARQTGRLFFLTGGTALAEYYLRHRLTEDIDLFTTDDEALELARREIQHIAAELDSSVNSILSTPTFQRFELSHANSAPVKLDLVRDVDFQFGQHATIDNVIVDSIENIGANKVTAIFGRTESKDFVDLYFLLEGGQDFRTLVSHAKEKDSGLTEFWLAGMMRQVTKLKTLPEMLRPLTLEMLKEYFLALADEQFREVRPPD